MKRAIQLSAIGVVAASLMIGAGASTGAGSGGPPLVCHEFEIGDAASLPLSGRSGASTRGKLAAETLDLLKPQMPIIVRMETLRRAVVLGAQEPGVVREIMSALQARVLDSEARGASDALSWFDAAFLAASWDQWDSDRAPDVGVADGCVGYAWLRKAIASGKEAPEMEFAAALVTHPAMHRETQRLYEEHLAKAAGGAASGSLLEQNMKTHCQNWSQSYETLKMKGGAGSDSDRNR